MKGAVSMGVKGVMLIVSGLMCLVGFLVVFLGYKKKKRCTEPAVAEIVDIKRSEETDDKGGKSFSYRPVLEFKVGVETVRKEAGVSSNKRKAYKIGDRVNIRFNPLKPKEFMTTKQKTGAFTGVVLMIFAAVIAGVTLYFG
jgi:hypothetical protein